MIYFELNNGIKIPSIGYGTYKAEGNKVFQGVLWALETGYRSIDTASFYGNETEIGDAIIKSGISRKEIFLTSKVWNTQQGYENTLKAFEESLSKLQTDYLDLYLVHWPVKGNFIDTWKALEKLYKEKKVRAIGVCNFMQHHLEELLINSEIKPVINQVEFHPYLNQEDLLNYCKENDIILEAWRPIMKGQVNEIPQIIEISNKYNKTPVQVVLRWQIQKNIITIPKSTTKERIESNFNIFDFELNQEDIKIIDSLNKDERMGPHPDEIDF
jgi:diketogulonate reductase-like aldo/keto reductase